LYVNIKIIMIQEIQIYYFYFWRFGNVATMKFLEPPQEDTRGRIFSWGLLHRSFPRKFRIVKRQTHAHASDYVIESAKFFYITTPSHAPLLHSPASH
jgi:hypothetical protein